MSKDDRWQRLELLKMSSLPSFPFYSSQATSLLVGATHIWGASPHSQFTGLYVSHSQTPRTATSSAALGKLAGEEDREEVKESVMKMQKTEIRRSVLSEKKTAQWLQSIYLYT